MNEPKIQSTEERLSALYKKHEELRGKSKDANKNFLECRARKNHLESELHKVETEIELIEQGQLCFGDIA